MLVKLLEDEPLLTRQNVRDGLDDCLQLGSASNMLPFLHARKSK